MGWSSSNSGGRAGGMSKSLPRRVQCAAVAATEAVDYGERTNERELVSPVFVQRDGCRVARASSLAGDRTRRNLASDERRSCKAFALRSDEYLSRWRVAGAKAGLTTRREPRRPARALRDAGMEVVYTGLHRTPEQIQSAAVARGRHASSILVRRHMTLMPASSRCSRRRAFGHPVEVGGVIPDGRRRAAPQLGIAECSVPDTARRHRGAGYGTWRQPVPRSDLGSRPDRRERGVTPRWRHAKTRRTGPPPATCTGLPEAERARPRSAKRSCC